MLIFNLPETAVKKKLYINYIERELGIKVTVRKLSTVVRLISL